MNEALIFVLHKDKKIVLSIVHYGAHKEVALLMGEYFIPVDLWFQKGDIGRGKEVLPLYTALDLRDAIEQAEKFVRCVTVGGDAS